MFVLFKDIDLDSLAAAEIAHQVPNDPGSEINEINNLFK